MLLLSRLSMVLEISESEIARRCGLTQQVLNRYTNEGITLSVQKLLKICNALRMPARYFVTEGNNFALPNREIATIPLDCWHPIEWDTQAVEHTFGDGGGRIYWKDVAIIMEASPQKPHERFTLRRRFKVTDFLHTCSVLDISPFKFLIDKNCDNSKQKAGKRTDSTSRYAEESLRAEVKALTLQLAELNGTVLDLATKYDELMRRHADLLGRHNELDRKVNELVGYGRPLMAAEDEVVEG